jgi:hypothetical protein
MRKTRLAVAIFLCSAACIHAESLKTLVTGGDNAKAVIKPPVAMPEPSGFASLAVDFALVSIAAWAFRRKLSSSDSQ